MIDNDISNFVLVCYYDKNTNKLVHIEQYGDNSGNIETDIKSYEYGYNAKIIKPEELFKQLSRKTQECEELKHQIEDVDTLCSKKSWEIGNLGYKIKNQRKEINKLQQQLDQAKAAKEQAEQKLEKIREYCNKYPQNSIGFKKNILQIIGEVE